MNNVKKRSLVTVLATTALLTACSSAENANQVEQANNKEQSDSRTVAADAQDRAVRITADSSSTEQLLWAYIYRHVLRESGREAHVLGDDAASTADRWEQLQTGKADFMITCTGKFVEDTSPVLAKELASQQDEDEQRDPNATDIHEHLHREVMGLLPVHIVTTNPSSAEGCPDAELDLPQDFTPLFSSRLFDREEFGAIAGVTRLIDKRALEELEDKLADGLSAEDAVGQWASVNVTGESLDSVSDEA